MVKVCPSILSADMVNLERDVRALAPVGADYIHVDDTKDAVRKAVRMERRVELCCEGSRWIDIRRWRTVAQGDNPYDPNDYLPDMVGDNYGMNAQGKTEEEFYKRTVYQYRTWKQCYYWMPVFIDEINKNPNLVQAPFWN